MRQLVLYFTLTAAAVHAFASAGTILNSFTLPGLTEYGPRGLAYDPGSGYFYVTTPVRPNNVRVIKFTYDGSTASVVSTFTCDDGFYWPMDAAWEVNLASAEDIVDGSTARVLFIKDGTGDIITSFDGPFGEGVHLNGLTWNGAFLFASSYDSNVIYKLTSTGEEAGSFQIPKAGATGLAWGLGRLWAVIGDPYSDYLVYKLTETGTVEATYTYDIGDLYVGGACWCRDSQESVLISTFTGGKYIYEIGFAADAAVVPASLGRVKAGFRQTRPKTSPGVPPNGILP